MYTNQAAANKITFEHKGTLNIFSWKIQIYGKKVKKVVPLDEIELACDKLDRDIKRARYVDEYRVINCLR
jgi:hypothetical protein